MRESILCATDLTQSSAPAVARAAWLARRWEARLTLLHVADSEQLPDVVADEIRDTTAALRAGLDGLEAPAGAAVLVRSGDPFEVILDTAGQVAASIIVLGAHRRRRFLDIFRGTTAERVIRAGSLPVLMTHRPPEAGWRHVMIATDLSESSRHALLTARDLGLLEAERITVVHAFAPIARMVMSYQGAPSDQIRREVAAEREALRRRLRRFIADCDPALRADAVVVEGDAPGALQRAVTHRRADLLVVGTLGASGFRRLILGSIAEAVLARASVDVLAVPPPR